MTFNKKFFKSVDFWFAIAFIAVLCIFWGQIERIKADSAKIMPAVIIIASVFCCVGILTRSLFSTEKKKSGKTPWKQVLLLLGVLLFTAAVILAAKIIGMYTALFLSIAAISLSISWMEGKMSMKDLVSIFAYDLTTILVVYLLFHVFLQVSTPRGFLI